MQKRIYAVAAAAAIGIVLWPRQSTSSRWSIIGRLLRNVRSGGSHLASNDPVLRALPHFELASDGFTDGGPMSSPYVGVHGRQPPLSWNGVPAGTVELALIVEDQDVPFFTPLVHAIAYGIDPERQRLEAAAIPPPTQRYAHDPGITVGRGSGGRAFLPPTPIPGHGPHHYVFELFALRERLTFNRPAAKKELVAALRDAAIGVATATGTHEVP